MTQPIETPQPTDQIQKRVELRAPVARVWRALTDSKEFSTWFGVQIDGAFDPQATVRGTMTCGGDGPVEFQLWVEEVAAEHTFTFRWHPHAVDPTEDYSNEPTTLVTFRLEAITEGTRLTVTESGFDALPDARRSLAYKMNEGGWTVQMERIREHVDG